MGMLRILVGVLMAAWMAGASASGSVEVRFVEPQRYADIGLRVSDRENNLAQLRAHLEAFATRLPDGQRLSVDVLDVDLAGEELPSRHGDSLRVLRGRADWPRMRLRWQLTGPGGVERGAEEWLADVVYLNRLPPGFGANEALPYERRMLEEWFQARIVAGQPTR